MKIRNSGIEITDICEQIPNIIVSASGVARIDFRTAAGGLAASNEMTAADLAALREAIDAALGNVRPRKVRDRANDDWTWLDGHSGYVVDVEDHRDCSPSCRDGRTLEYVKENWGPLTIIE